MRVLGLLLLASLTGCARNECQCARPGIAILIENGGDPQTLAAQTTLSGAGCAGSHVQVLGQELWIDGTNNGACHIEVSTSQETFSFDSQLSYANGCCSGYHALPSSFTVPAAPGDGGASD